MYSVTEFTNPDQLEGLKTVWQKLLDQTDSGNLFLTYEWVSTWLKNFWNGRPIYFLLASKDGMPKALALFLPDHEKGYLRFPADEYSHRPDVLLAEQDPSHLEALFSHVKGSAVEQRFYLHQLLSNSALVQVMPEICRRLKLVHVVEESYNSPFLTISGDWAGYIGTKSKHFQREQRRKMNKILKAGDVDFKIVSEADFCARTMADIFQIEKNSWKEGAGTSFTADQRLERFYGEIALKCAIRGWLRIYMLYFNSKPLAHIYGIVYKNKYYALKTSYDSRYKKLSPGVVVFNLALQDIFRCDFKEFDFLGVESRWKNELTSEIRKHVDLYIYPRSLTSLGKQNYEHKFKPFIREKMPYILSMKRGLKRALFKKNY